MFAHDICNSQIEYLSNSLNFTRKDRAKPPLRPVSLYSLGAGSGLAGVARLRLGERYHKSSIFNLQFRLARARRLSLNNLEHISFLGLAGSGTQDSPDGQCIPALFANDHSHIAFGNTEF